MEKSIIDALLDGDVSVDDVINASNLKEADFKDKSDDDIHKFVKSMQQKKHPWDFAHDKPKDTRTVSDQPSFKCSSCGEKAKYPSGTAKPAMCLDCANDLEKHYR